MTRRSILFQNNYCYITVESKSAKWIQLLIQGHVISTSYKEIEKLIKEGSSPTYCFTKEALIKISSAVSCFVKKYHHIYKSLRSYTMLTLGSDFIWIYVPRDKVEEFLNSVEPILNRRESFTTKSWPIDKNIPDDPRGIYNVVGIVKWLTFSDCSDLPSDSSYKIKRR